MDKAKSISPVILDPIVTTRMTVFNGQADYGTADDRFSSEK
jgi:hypothetical protein